MAETTISTESTQITAVSESTVSDVASETKLTSAWRPILMFVFIGIIANNYILYPYISLFVKSAPPLVLPDPLWDLIKLAVSIYTGGRSMEKILPDLVTIIKK